MFNIIKLFVVWTYIFQSVTLNVVIGIYVELDGISDFYYRVGCFEGSKVNSGKLL